MRGNSDFLDSIIQCLIDDYKNNSKMKLIICGSYIDVVTLNKFGYDFYEVKFTERPVDNTIVNEEIFQLEKANIKYNRLGFISKSGFNISDKEKYILISLDDIYSL